MFCQPSPLLRSDFDMIIFSFYILYKSLMQFFQNTKELSKWKDSLSSKELQGILGESKELQRTPKNS